MSEHEHDHVHGEDCGCGEEEHVFVLTDENGEEHEMILAMTFPAGGREYAVLLDRNDPEADGLIFRVEEENEEVFLVHIEDDQEWETALARYTEILEEDQ